MVSRVETIVFIIRDSFFEMSGGRREKFRIEKRKRISWSRLLYEIFTESLGNQGLPDI